MKLADPTLREILAGQYVLGTMKPRVKARFERELRSDDGLARLVTDWADKFAPLDESAPTEMPPDRVWRAIEQRLPPLIPAKLAAPRASWWDKLGLWRGLALATTAAAAGLALYIAAAPAPSPRVVAILSDPAGHPGWVALAGAHRGQVEIAALGPASIDRAHDFELWAIAGGPPRPLGLLTEGPDHRLILPASALPGTGGVLAVSLEPAGGSPTGRPTGPVLSQGSVL